MPELHAAKIGQFCWYELGTSDQAGAKNFYPSLLGWTVNDVPMGPEGVYTIFQLRGRDVGAAYTLMEHQRKSGIPPHWLTYIAVANADETAARAGSLGGKVLAQPFDVYDLGRMAVIQDPTGATFGIWQSKKHHGVGIQNELNAFGWSELLTRDTESARKFYTQLFGWDTYVSEADKMAYTHWRLGGVDFGGMMQMTPHMEKVPPHWMNYITVENCDQTVAKANQLGGKTLMPALDVPNVGRFATLADPQGAAFAIITLAPMHKG